VSVGKLYRLGDNQFIGSVNYRLFHHPEAINQCGELTPINYILLGEGDLFVIELEDKRKSKCHLRKRVNRAVSWFPPRYTYHATCFS